MDTEETVKKAAVGLTIAVLAANIFTKPEHGDSHPHHETVSLISDQSTGFLVYGYMHPQLQRRWLSKLDDPMIPTMIQSLDK